MSIFIMTHMHGALKPTRHPVLSASRLLLIVGLLISATVGSASAAEDAEAKTKASGLPVAEIKRNEPVDFEREILPIFKSNCLACHNQTKAKAGLVLETPQTIAHGGDSGVAVDPGKGASSLLLKAAAHQDEDVIMPPKNNKVAAADLNPQQLGLIKLWIDQGATGEVRSAGPIEWQPLPAGLNPIYAVAITSDGQYAACGRANQIFIYHLPSGQLVTRLTDDRLISDGRDGKPGVAHRDLVHSLAFSPDGMLLASGGYREAKLWRRPLPRPTLTFEAPVGSLLTSVSADRKWLAAAGSNNVITIWEIATGRQQKALPASEKPLTSFQFSPDNVWLACAADNVLSIWKVSDAMPVMQTNTASWINALAWLAGGKQLATGGKDNLIHVWQWSATNPTALVLTNELKGHVGPITSLAATAEPNQLLSGSEDGTLRLWAIDKGEAIKNLKHGGAVAAVAVRPDGKRFASAGLTNVVKLWDAGEGKQVTELKGDSNSELQVARRQRAQTLANTEVDYQKGLLKTAEEEQKKEETRLKKATEAHETGRKNYTEKEKALADARTAKTNSEKSLADLDVELTRAKEQLASTEKAAQEADVQYKEAAALSAPVPEEVEKRKVDAEAKAKVVADSKAHLEKLNNDAKAKDKELKEKIKASEKDIADKEKELKKVELARNNAETEFTLAKKSVEQTGKTIADTKGGIERAEESKKQADAGLEQARTSATSAEKPIRALAFSPDNRLLASSGDDRAIHTWSAESGSACASFTNLAGAGSSLEFIGDDTVLAAGAEGSARLYELESPWVLETQIGSGDSSSPILDRVNALAFSPDGTMLATGGGEPSRSGEILLWQVADGKMLRALKDIHSDTVLDLEFSPDGKFLGSAAADRFVRIVDVQSGKVVKALEGHTHHVLGLSWKADGRTLASAGADNVIKIWDVTTGERKKNIEGFGKEVTAVNFVGVTDQVLGSAGDSKVRLVRDNGSDVRSFAGANDFIHCCAVTPDGKTVVAGGEDGVLRVWDVEKGKQVATLEPSK